MRTISEEALEALRKRYPAGCLVELVYMNDPYNKKLTPGCKGTVKFVDDIQISKAQLLRILSASDSIQCACKFLFGLFDFSSVFQIVF